MDQISVLAAAGMQARMQSLDLVANNMANASTTGYKGDSEFYSVFTSEAADDDGSGVPTTLPMIQRQWTDLSQGLLEPTNNPTDVALSGKGFFVVTGPSSPLYTRSGSFKVASSGELTTSDGYAVLTQGGGTIKADATQPIEISQDGSVRQNGQSLGQLQLVDFNDPSALVKQGSNYFRNPSSQAPIDAADVQVYQGKVEASNVSAAHSAVRLIGVMRQFEMLQKAMTLAGDMNSKQFRKWPKWK